MGYPDKPFPTAKASLALVAAVLLVAFVFLVPVRTKFGMRGNYSYTTWDLLVGNAGKPVR